MSIYRSTKSPYWQYDFQVGGARFHGSTGCAAKRDAERFEANVRRRAVLGDDTKPAITLDEACGIWWAAKGSRMKSLATNRIQIKSLLAGLGKSTAIASIGLTAFDRYIAKRRVGRSNATVNREIELARRIWRFAADRGFDAPDVKWGALLQPEPKERIRELSTDEETALFAQLDADLAAVVEFAMLSGQRRTEVIRLRWSDVDLTAGRATFDTKSVGGERHVLPLTPRMVALVANRPKVGPFVFTYVCKRTTARHRAKRVKGVRYPYSKQGWAREWRQALERAGVSDFKFHDLRHTAGTRALRATGNLKGVQRMLNHADIATTARYAHALESDVRDMMIAAESQNSPGLKTGLHADTRTKLRKAG